MIRYMKNTSSMKKSQALRDSSWLDKAVAKHGDRYDYSRVQYENRHKPVEVVCREHGSFMQAMGAHLKGTGCPSCAGLKPVSWGEFLRRAREKHGGRFEYDESSYEGWAKKLRVRCPEHGWFQQRAVAHVEKTGGCAKCAHAASGGLRRKRGKVVELGLTLAAPEFTGMGAPLGVVCEKHGPYVVARAGDVVYSGVRCPRCATTVSKWESEVKAFLDSIGVSTERTRKIIAPKEIDLYSEEHKVGVECHGVRFHSTAFQQSATAHLNKLRLAQQAGIRLLQVFEDEWKYRRAAVENMLRSAFGKAEKTYARHCTVVKTDSASVREFLDEHHMQGAAKGSVVYALHKDDAAVAVMVFSKVTSERGAKDAGWELVRYASSGAVTGGASRLFKSFVREHKPERVISYSDRRLFSGGMYEKLGFRKVHDTRPNYAVLVGDKRLHKAGFKRELLEKKLPDFDPAKSERENCEAHGWFRVYDCGLTKWEILDASEKH